MTANALVVTINWPEEPDRGSETYGPFKDQEERAKWVDDCVEAAKQGWRILDGAHYLLHRVETPFDPNALWERQDAMEVRHDDTETPTVEDWAEIKAAHRSLGHAAVPVVMCSNPRCVEAIMVLRRRREESHA